MFKFLLSIVICIVIAISFLAYKNSQKTFEAKFKNIDGLPIGAPVSALGVKVGEVIKTKPVNDGVIVKVKITNKFFPIPPPGSQLNITSFTPNGGRILEIILPEETSKRKSYIVQDPITTESWLSAAFELFNGLQATSEGIIKNFTSENLSKVRNSLNDTSESLDGVATKLNDYNKTLTNIKEKFSNKANETNTIIEKMYKPLAHANKVISDNETISSFKFHLVELTKNLGNISDKISSQEFLTDLDSTKKNILNNLTQINTSLINENEQLHNQGIATMTKELNENITNLNKQVDNLNKKDIGQFVKENLAKAKEAVIKFQTTISNLRNQ